MKPDREMYQAMERHNGKGVGLVSIKFCTTETTIEKAKTLLSKKQEKFWRDWKPYGNIWTIMLKEDEKGKQIIARARYV